MSLNIKIENFEGPFDLLLHLIKKNEMDIYNIRIYEITTQYLNYLNSMKELDLEVTSEFIVIAATLLEIKSKMLLPKQETEENEEDEEDPRKELINKLLEYKKFKQIANFLKEREENMGFMYSKKPEIIEDIPKDDNNDILKGLTILKLFNIYNDLINTYKNKMNTENVIQREIPLDKFKIEDKMIKISESLSSGETIKFSKLIGTCETKIEAIVTFLALLELIKLRLVAVAQEGNFREIYLEGIKQNEEE
ncbi:segregation/condensation protein A [Clostridium botulinum]|uniref:Segregation and condensation protein A n=1 Tax=Clostridium botulinum C/D str. DC5 TaxID=1443128 RepID=A0A0A0IQZ6_CLOBO|nr:segregation/condensation protein A [Clostridium botulinum]KEI07078.1 segregation and condensation protein A [Clostridium botulinum C/D str. BKT75002]KEI12155.1 segregation and condensation protein A [Clostridium botulinum C/D str. BKT2873]KGM96840.1 segregation and condensation protein A [Clostridium botulinum D str. CCUG 7971]KGN01946.1 segregation and condensation protein A [Clostridium botulinum C/D str. DC5]KOC48583.1 segregation and condensation protein A [Clostridium botulinum]